MIQVDRIHHSANLISCKFSTKRVLERMKEADSDREIDRDSERCVT